MAGVSATTDVMKNPLCQVSCNVDSERCLKRQFMHLHFTCKRSEKVYQKAVDRLISHLGMQLLSIVALGKVCELLLGSVAFKPLTT